MIAAVSRLLVLALVLLLAGNFAARASGIADRVPRSKPVTALQPERSHVLAPKIARASEPSPSASIHPFRQTSMSLDDMTSEYDLSSDLFPQQSHKHSLIEHAVSPHAATHQLSVPLVRSELGHQQIQQSFLAIRERQRLHSPEQHMKNFVSKMKSILPETESNQVDEMSHEQLLDLIETHAEMFEHSDAPGARETLSLLELDTNTQTTSLLETAASASAQDLPLHQEMLNEKHIATYYGSVSIDNQDFRVLLDTGSCELWVPSQKCSTARCMKHRRYEIHENKAEKESDSAFLETSADPTHFIKNKHLKVKYIAGSISGPMINSQVKLDDITIPNQAVGLAETLDIALLDDVKWDGIIGLSYPSAKIKRRGLLPLFDNIMQQRLLTNPNKSLVNQFAYYIDDQKGQMTFGGVNCEYVVANSHKAEAHSHSFIAAAAKTSTSTEAKAESQIQTEVKKCKNSFQFAPVSRKSYWTITLDDVTLDFPQNTPENAHIRRKGNCGLKGCRAIVDTGTFLLYTSKFFHTPAAFSDNQADKHTNCNPTALAALPNVTFHIRTDLNGQAHSMPVALTLTPQDYVLQFPQQKRKEEHLVGTQETTQSVNECLVGISPDQGSAFTLGQVFLRSYYTLFDRDNDRIGFSRINRA